MRFFVITTLITVLIVLSAGIGYSIYTKITGSENSILSTIDDIQKKEEVKNESFNILVLGIDDLGIHTDTIILANFDTYDKNIDIMSIPRDLKIDLTEEQRSKGKYVPETIKLTEVLAYAGEANGIEYTKYLVEDILGEEIDYWVSVELDAFKYLVDEIGGVEFDVPINMYYHDPYQDLYINIKKGLQTLDGEKAEQLIRFRSGYPNGDLGRIEMQQNFLKALMSQLLNSDNKIETILAVAKTAIKYTDNNIAILDITENIKYLDDVDVSKIRSFSMPVENITYKGKSFVELIEEDFEDILLDIFHPINEDAEFVSSEDLDITILNGSNQNGVASSTKDILEKDGFTVSKIDSYDGTKQDFTRIYIKNSSYGHDLLHYFDNPKVLLDKSLLEDIKIVVGENDADIKTVDFE